MRKEKGRGGRESCDIHTSMSSKIRIGIVLIAKSFSVSTAVRTSSIIEDNSEPEKRNGTLAGQWVSCQWCCADQTSPIVRRSRQWKPVKHWPASVCRPDDLLLTSTARPMTAQQRGRHRERYPVTHDARGLCCAETRCCAACKFKVSSVLTCTLSSKTLSM